jgi:lipopolysaccharide transport system permease protein
LSALNVEYRDIRVVIPFVLQLWMYGTPVAYPLRVLPARYQWIAKINPMTGIIETFRACLLGQPLPWASFAYSTAVTLVVTISGAFYFRRVERQFADVL